MSAPTTSAQRGSATKSRVRTSVALALVLCALGAGGPSLARAAEEPWWNLESRAAPSHLAPGQQGMITVMATNLGNQSMSGERTPIRISDRLPPGVSPVLLPGHSSAIEATVSTGGSVSCSEGATPSCEYKGALPPYELLRMRIAVQVASEVSAQETNTIIAEGGEAQLCAKTAEAGGGQFADDLCRQQGGERDFELQLGTPVARAEQPEPVSLSGGETPFGVERYEIKPEEVGGGPDMQAGSHPYQLTTTLAFNEVLEREEFEQGGHPTVFLAPTTAGQPRNLDFTLPAGLVGDAAVIPQCSGSDFSFERPGSAGNLCKPDTVVGVATASATSKGGPLKGAEDLFTEPIFNLTPAVGEPARFGFTVDRVPIFLDTSVRSGSDYAVVVRADNISESVHTMLSRTTFWGVPEDSSHDNARGWACVLHGSNSFSPGEPCTRPQRSGPPSAFEDMPTACTGPLSSTLSGNSWPTAASPQGAELSPGGPISAPFPEMLGCNLLEFTPGFEALPEVQSANTPSGLTANVKLPQQALTAAEGLFQPALRNTLTTLPPGLLLSPAAADGLQACSEAEIGFTGVEAQTGRDEFTAEEPGCPDASKVGTAEIVSPLLANPLVGSVYLAAEDANPFGSLFALYLVAHDPTSGVLVKLAGRVTANPLTGQLVTSFENTPEQPATEVKLRFFGGERASLTTPPKCGSYAASATMSPWSGGEAIAAESRFSLSSGPNSSACVSPLPLIPGVQAGTTNPQGGSFSPFQLQLTHRDEDQALTSLTVHLPSGLAALIAKVTPCPEPQAQAGTCGAQSLIGHLTTASGLGPDPFTLPGSVYLTGPYAGAPFGLSIVIPAVAGPFNLGTVVVRSTISVNPETAAVTIATPLPTMVNTAQAGQTGVPVQLKRSEIVIDRPEFEFNPTNCRSLKVEATATGDEGANAATYSNFQARGCAALPFKPTFTAQSDARTSKANGASLRVKVTSRGLGQADIAKTTITLPAQLPSRLTTLQKACLAAVFAVNPASCPPGSNIGTATIHTPVFKHPLSGPAYLVSHGNTAFPDVEFVLQGEGLTIVLDGKTRIKKGVTTSSFETLPDAPFTSFETTLPQGPHSVLATNGSLCADRTVSETKLVTRHSHGHKVHVRVKVTRKVAPYLPMPTTITAQNGAVIKQSTRVQIGHCPPAPRKKAKKAARAHGRRARLSA